MSGRRWCLEQSEEPEWMDAPGHPPEVIAENLNDLRRVNRLLGGIWLTRRPLARLVAAVPAGETLRILDVASGGADIARAISGDAARRGRSILVVASDVSAAFLAVARDRWPDDGSLRYVAADARHLPFAAGTFHVVTSSLMLHHLGWADALAALKEKRRCASVGIVVNDILRNWLCYFGAILATRLGSRNALTRHDGPLSARRAYTARELHDLAGRAGLSVTSWYAFLFYRVGFSAVPAGVEHWSAAWLAGGSDDGRQTKHECRLAARALAPLGASSSSFAWRRRGVTGAHERGRRR